MSSFAILARDLGKRYRIGTPERYKALRDKLAGVMGAPLRAVRRLAERATLDNEATRATTFWALRNVSFEVQPGEVLGVIGGNGAGKSTLLKLLSRITEPTEGYAELQGRVGSLLEVGTGFHPELTGRENIFLNGAILGMAQRDIRRKFAEIVDFAAIDRFIDTPVKRYSSGMYTRLGFSVAAHLEPQILIVDEVLAVGDAAFQKKCLGKMDEAAKNGKTVIFVSHNMSAVESLCTRVMLLEAGRVVRSGSSSEVIALYLDRLACNATRSINERRDRGGDGTAICTDVWFEDDTGRRVTTVLSGRPLRVALRYELRRPSSRFEFRIGFYDRGGTCIAHNSTEYAPLPQASLPGSGVISCTVPRLPLPAGQYYVNTSIVRDGSIGADRVERAAAFTVEPGDFYRSGKIPPASYGKTLFDYTWNLRAADRDIAA